MRGPLLQELAKLVWLTKNGDASAYGANDGVSSCGASIYGGDNSCAIRNNCCDSNDEDFPNDHNNDFCSHNAGDISGDGDEK